ncbi:C-type lectin domain family 4 member E isoform X1 [Misgurnus anguillicaudatus]|uniref:C-type lectin domain family 4 member E isoform X1 n=1 Tax=Misgurnus anguillicaudatus TaxID=75329 RepID=UPI003CCF25A0
MALEAFYENIQHRNANRSKSEPRTSSQNRGRSRWFVPITVLLGLICVLLVAALIVLNIHLTSERDLMKMSYMDISKEYNETLNGLMMNYSQLTKEREELQNRFNFMSQKKLELETKVKNLNDALMKKSETYPYSKADYKRTTQVYISTEKKSWSDSRQFCRDSGGDLIIINTEEEQIYISSIAKDVVWIGLSDIAEEGKMKWVDNTPLIKGFWVENEPNDFSGSEDCVDLNPTKPVLNNWNDLPCTDTRKWICDK